MATHRTYGNRRKSRGFAHASSLLEQKVRDVSQSRGFAVSRVLTHWEEIAGVEMARMARPVKVGYGRAGLGATLTLLTTGPNAPVVEMNKEQLRARVNAAYGYAAISRINLTQTAPTGFAEGGTPFEARPASSASSAGELARAPAPAAQREARALVAKVQDPAFRRALEALGGNVLTRSKNQT